MKANIQFGLAILFLLFRNSAEAGVIQVGGMDAADDGFVSARAGVCTVNFNSGNGKNICLATYSRDAAGTIALDSSNFPTGTGERHAAPIGDTSAYLSVGTSDGTPIYVNLSMPANYFGFYAGSLDTFNLVQFYRSGALVDSFDGGQINAVAFPGQATIGNRSEARYIDYFPGRFAVGQFVPAMFDRVRIGSAGDSFETDNHAFGLVTLSVPEPGWLSFAGIAALLASWLLQRKKFRRV